MTGGVHLGASRNYFAVHVDDVFAADDRWDTQLNCTPGDVDCTNNSGTPNPIRMTPADVDYATAWELSRHFTLDLAYNGSGSVDQREDNDASTSSPTNSSRTATSSAGSTTPTRTRSSAARRTPPWSPGSA